MVVGVKLGCGDLDTCSERQPEPAPFVTGTQLELARRNSRRQKVLRLAVVLGSNIVSQVGFKFRPEILVDAILRRGIPGDRAAQLIRVPGGQRSTERRDDIELPKSLAGQKRRRHRCIRAAVAVTSGWDGGAELCAQQIVAAFLIAR